MLGAPSQTLFVTGGRGRLATLIADHFATTPHRVELYSRRGGSGFHALSTLLSSDSLAKADVIMHLAWSTLPATSEQAPRHAPTEDLVLLERLLAGIAALPQAKRPLLVFFSSGGAVYGNAVERPSREDDELRPIGQYGREKLAAERLILERARRDGVAATVLRISNPYGYPVPKSRAQGLVPHALRCAMEGDPLPLWGDGSAKKDFLYYTDFLVALERVLARRLTGVFNLSAGESHSVNEVLAEVERQTGRRLVVEPRTAPSWDVQDSRLDNSRLVAATGWQPRISLAEGIRRAAVGYRAL